MTKAFGRTQALKDVSFELARGSIHALLGGNGSGKSTLIKILAGVESADAGTLVVGSERHGLRTMTPAQARDLGLRFVHQQSSIFPDLTVAENLAVGSGFETGAAGRIRWRALRGAAAATLDRFGIEAHPDVELGELSPATQTMVAIARALREEDEVGHGALVLDEPTSALPDAEVSLLLDALRRYAAAGHTILYVTHRLEEVLAAADRATLLRDGELVGTVAPQDLTHDDLVELITGKTVKQVGRLRGKAAGPVVLETRQLEAGSLAPCDLSVRAGEIVGIAGLIGSGRSTLLKALFGVVPIRAGEVLVDGRRLAISSCPDAMRAGFALVPEDRASDASFSQLSVKENLSIAAIGQYWRGFRVRHRREAADARKLVERFLIKTESVDAPLSSLSGGNQQKVILARWLRREPKILLLDEPTQGVDVGARTEIYELVHEAVEAGAIALLASSDYEELTAICDRVLVLRKGRLIGELTGSELTSHRVQRLAHLEMESAA